MDRDRAIEAPLPYAEDLPPDGPQEILSLTWRSPEAELEALVATRKYDLSPSRTHEEKMDNLDLYVKARSLFAEGMGIEVWVEGNLNRAADTGFLSYLDDLRAREPEAVQQHIASLKMQVARRKRAGAQALQASLLTE